MNGVATKPFSTLLPTTSAPTPTPALPTPTTTTTLKPQKPGDPSISIKNAADNTTHVVVSPKPLPPKNPHSMPSNTCLKSSDLASLVSKDKKYKLFVKNDGEIVVMGPNGFKAWSSFRHHRRISFVTGKGPFFFCLKKDGSLVQYNSKKEVVWSTDCSEKGTGPFQLILSDGTGILQVIDTTRLVIWSSAFPMTCDEARASYLRNHKDVAQAGVDPWLHYADRVLKQKGGKKERRVWMGPKCKSCDDAKHIYKSQYPDFKNMSAEEHYLKFGRKQNREWRAPLQCLDTLRQDYILETGKSLISMNGNYVLLNQTGGDLVVFSTVSRKQVWSLKTKETTSPKINGANCRLKLTRSGNLVYTTLKNELIWQSDSGEKANHPFELKLQNDGNLYIQGRAKDPQKSIIVWASHWTKQCEEARQIYLRTYKEVAQSQVDPWVHYSEHVLRKPMGQKDAFLWVGPKCVTSCQSANEAYHRRYPQVSVNDAGWHYAEIGKKQNRVWQGMGKDPYRCVNSIISPGHIHTSITSPNGVYKANLSQSTGLFVVSSELGVVWQHTKHTSRRPSTKGPYTLQLQNDGNLVARNANGSIYWDTNSANLGYPPFKLIVSNMGNLQILDKRGVLVWSTGDGWQLTCAAAHERYKKEHGGGSWDDFLRSLLQKPEQKQVWRGPRCNQCSDAYARYIVEYPEVKNHQLNAAEHFVKIGKFQHRLWTGFDDCWKPPPSTSRPTTPTKQRLAQPTSLKPTLRPTTTKPPTPKPTTTVIDGKVYKLCKNPDNAQTPDEYGRRWGTEDGDTCVIYTNK
jgi:hypothetical protein